MNGAQQQISKMLAEVLGGINYVKASVLTPYYHMIGKSVSLTTILKGSFKIFFTLS